MEKVAQLFESFFSFIGARIDKLIESNSRTQYTQVSFITVTLEGSLKGKPLGQGKCKGVRLRFNYYQLDSSESQSGELIYYGDSRQQTWELFRSRTYLSDSKFIPCTDLSQIYIRLSSSDVPVTIEVAIYN